MHRTLNISTLTEYRERRFLCLQRSSRGEEQITLKIDPIKLPNESCVLILTACELILTVFSSGIHSLHPAGGQLVIARFTTTVVLPKPKKKEKKVAARDEVAKEKTRDDYARGKDHDVRKLCSNRDLEKHPLVEGK